MSDTITSTPNTESAATAQNAVPALDSIAQKMAAMRNQISATSETEAGTPAEAKAEAPVAPEGEDNDSSSVEPEVDSPESEEVELAQEDVDAPQEDEVSTRDSTEQEVIDFIEFAQENPNAKFKFMRNGKEMVIDAKRAAAILGQGGAIHEEARELKVQKAEFEEYLLEELDREYDATT